MSEIIFHAILSVAIAAILVYSHTEKDKGKLRLLFTKIWLNVALVHLVLVFIDQTLKFAEKLSNGAYYG